MTIKEVEEQTGLSRSNIRFYEKEKLIEPLRNEKNGYRDYSGEDVEDIKKIAYLRTLGVSIEEVRSVKSEGLALKEVIKKQNKVLQNQICELNHAKIRCEKMLDAENLSYEGLQVEQFVTELQDYWDDNKPVFKFDSVGFIYMWGSFTVWGVLTAMCLAVSLLSYASLPAEIPIQWNHGMASSLVNKAFIFAYPVICIAVRFFLRPFMQVRLRMNFIFSDTITEYLTNFLCFVALSVELFTILFLAGILEEVTVVLIVDSAVFLGLLLAGLVKIKSSIM